MKCPCNGCTERKLLCHGFCDRFKEFRKDLEAMKKWLAENDNKPLFGEGRRREMKKHERNTARGYTKRYSGGGGE